MITTGDSAPDDDGYQVQCSCHPSFAVMSSSRPPALAFAAFCAHAGFCTRGRNPRTPPMIVSRRMNLANGALLVFIEASLPDQI
ncbi:MAG: hypothetical protein ACK58T_45525, partial [Phycisphaerae bacterium]